jgi:hypothetical protein
MAVPMTWAPWPTWLEFQMQNYAVFNEAGYELREMEYRVTRTRPVLAAES